MSIGVRTVRRPVGDRRLQVEVLEDPGEQRLRRLKVEGDPHQPEQRDAGWDQDGVRGRRHRDVQHSGD